MSTDMSRPFENRVAIVTGASRGIGRAIARSLAQQGASVVVNYRARADEAEQVASAIQADGGTVQVVQADVSVADDVTRLVAAATTTFGHIDVLVNNAGITRDGLILRMSEDDWNAVLSTNLTSTFLMTRAVLRPMIRQRYGRIVNISSVSGVMGNAGQANYAASKAGMIGLTRSTAREVADRNVTCNALAVGMVDTEIWAGVPEAAMQSILGMIPMGRKGTPEDVAHAVSFLAAEAASYITGQVLHVDGGLVMG
jgi:3-oxoacyl-[acyl-carrier protein] reductase